MRDFGLTGSVALVVTVPVLFLVLDPAGSWPMGLLNLIAFGAVIAAGWLWQRAGTPAASRQAFGWGWHKLSSPWWPGVVGVILVAWGGGVVLAELGQLLARLWPVPAALALALEKIYRLETWLVLVPLMLVAPLTEEGLFRGLLLPSLGRRYGSWPAIVLTSALFGLVHLNPWQGLPAFLAGLYLGSLRLSSGGLALPLLAHALFNGLPVLLAGLGLTAAGYNLAGGTPGESVPAPLLVAGIAVLAGGLALPAAVRLFRARVF